MGSDASDSEAKLLARCRSGDEAAREELARRYLPLLMKLSAGLFLQGGEHQDLIQEGLIGLFEAVEDYREDRGATFSTFAALCVSRRMKRAVSASRTRRNQVLNESLSLQSKEMEAEAADAKRLPENVVIDRESSREQMDFLRKQLSRLELQVLEYMLEGLDYREIAERTGRTPKSIDNARQRINRKLQAYLKTAYEESSMRGREDS